MEATRTRSRCTAGSVLPRPTLCAAHPHAHDRRAGEAIFWAELRHWTTGGISPPQLCLTVRAECLRGAMSDRLRARPAAPTTCTRPPPQSAACEPITPTEPGRPELFELGAPRRCVRPARALRRQVLEPRRIHSSFLGRQRQLAPHVLARGAGSAATARSSSGEELRCVPARAEPIGQSPQDSRAEQARRAGRCRLRAQSQANWSESSARGARWAAPRRHTHSIARAGREQGAVADP